MISIVMPVYNAADTLDEAFQSALKSGIGGQEIVLVDDGSTDGSWSLIQGYAANNPAVRAIQHDRNRGGGAARNTGVRASRHDLIFVLDSDDILADTGALGRAAALVTGRGLDGAAPGRSIFFKGNIRNVERVEEHVRADADFRTILSHNSLHFHGNILYRRDTFEEAGGYPEHHSFDTQGYSFRVLGNNARIAVTDEELYFRRLPNRPSYYIREASSGNASRNWFYILAEQLYKFNREVRELIIAYDYPNPMLLAKGEIIFKVLADRAVKEDIFSADGLRHDAASAYEAYTGANDETLQAWCAIADLRRNDANRCVERIVALGRSPARRMLYPLLASWSGNRLGPDELAELRYFFGETKSASWWTSHTLQRVRNRLGRLLR